MKADEWVHIKKRHVKDVPAMKLCHDICDHIYSLISATSNYFDNEQHLNTFGNKLIYDMHRKGGEPKQNNKYFFFHIFSILPNYKWVSVSNPTCLSAAIVLCYKVHLFLTQLSNAFVYTTISGNINKEYQFAIWITNMHDKFGLSENSSTSQNMHSQHNSIIIW